MNKLNIYTPLFKQLSTYNIAFANISRCSPPFISRNVFEFIDIMSINFA